MGCGSYIRTIIPPQLNRDVVNVMARKKCARRKKGVDIMLKPEYALRTGQDRTGQDRTGQDRTGQL